MLLLIAALVGGLLLFTHFHNRPPAATRARADVEKAYLAWWGARQKAFLQLDSASLKPFMTAAGLQQDEKRLADLQKPNHPLRLVAEHSNQIVVYRDGSTASVDDVWVDHSVELDPTTHSPIQPDPNLTIHDSTTLKRVKGRWLVDNVTRFGVSRDVPGQTVSYVAIAGGRPLPDSLRKEIEDSYLTYWRVSGEAYLALDPNLLDQVETGAALERDRSVMQQQITENQAILYDVQHNYRIAMEVDDTAWLYDTVEDRSVGVDRTTRHPLETRTSRMHRASYKLTKGPGGWKVDFVATS